MLKKVYCDASAPGLENIGYGNVVCLKKEFILLKDNLNEERKMLELEKENFESFYKKFETPNSNNNIDNKTMDEHSFDSNLAKCKNSSISDLDLIRQDLIRNNGNEYLVEKKTDDLSEGYAVPFQKEEHKKMETETENSEVMKKKYQKGYSNEESEEEESEEEETSQQEYVQGKGRREEDIRLKDEQEEGGKAKEDKKANHTIMGGGGLNLNEVSSSTDDVTAKKTLDGKMKNKIKNLLKLIEVLKKQLSQKDEEIYRMEAELHANTHSGVQHKQKKTKKIFETEEAVEEENSSPLGEIGNEYKDDELLLDQMKNMLLYQSEEIKFLKEMLEKKNKDFFLVQQENELKNEKLLEVKKELQTNHILLREYKNMQKEYEQLLNKKLGKNINSLEELKTDILEEHNINLTEKELHVEMQKKIIQALNEEIKKKEQTIYEMKNIIENLGINNNKDVIKYKQSNIDLLNKLNLNNSLLSNQKMEIENLHINFKQLEKDLKNKDIEIKKLHEHILEKEEENNKLKANINKLNFDLEIKYVALLNMKKKLKYNQKQNSLDLKKQKELFLNTLHTECVTRDEAVSRKENELTKLMNEYDQLVSVNQKLEKYIEKLNEKIVKKEKAIYEIQDKLLSCQAKLLVHENNNEVQLLQKNEEHLRKKLDEQIYRNEQLINNSFLLQKSTMENNTLEKKIIELKGIVFAKEEEIKKLKEQNKKKHGDSYLSAQNLNTAPNLLHNNGMPLKPIVNLLSRNNDTFAEHLIENYQKKNSTIDILFTPNKEDPVDLALFDYLNCFRKNSHNSLKLKKIDTNVYNINGKQVIVRFLNGELYVEDNSYPVKLQIYLHQINKEQ